MKKSFKLAILAIAAITMLAGCSSEKTAIKNENPVQAKVEDQTATPEAGKVSEKEPVVPEEKVEDIWTYYNDTTWSDDFNGIISTIEKVVVSDKVPKDGNKDDPTASAVGVVMKIENTTENIYTTYPDQAELVTSTGEQISADMFYSDHLGGELEEGVIKQGNVIFSLQRGHAADIKWIKMKWYVTEGDGMQMDAKRKEYSVKLELK
ncbi:hypothetical protein [Paenibacillus macquariensis]|uniref:Lipoprotein n=1 Tax=Paenibacillus macquariensis TaxID=948756 RepID=A0ABY1JSA2_9BACL|nr:hypothetical protein [Paenibacillus macquariensis]MEC0092902.1 hypothetical protein [Paenibacillus macquariensis]OAB36271.1 hypothetical protein PMSM_07435 [Paenibacillus macquariensis subsp. macquariensis]SIQ68429.1 hypothetical protein SAMN05421578_103356 [Paenibacillus macquariensis]